MKTILLAAVVLFAGIAVGQNKPDQFTETGNDFLAQCSNALDATANRDQAKNCLMWIKGFDDGIGAANAYESSETGTSAKAKICYPEQGVPVSQDLRVVLKFMSDHPSHLSKPAPVLAFMALKQAFPCP